MIPLDPADYDQLPPPDIYDCECCGGAGTVPVDYDPETGRWFDDECPWCRGSGDHNTHAGAA